MCSDSARIRSRALKVAVNVCNKALSSVQFLMRLSHGESLVRRRWDTSYCKLCNWIFDGFTLDHGQSCQLNTNQGHSSSECMVSIERRVVGTTIQSSSFSMILNKGLLACWPLLCECRREYLRRNLKVKLAAPQCACAPLQRTSTET